MWQYSDDVAFVESGREVFCLSTTDRSSRVVRISGSGVCIWELLPGRTTSEVIAALQKSSPDSARFEILSGTADFVRYLRELGYIVER